jgi:hypothetical protein
MVDGCKAAMTNEAPEKPPATSCQISPRPPFPAPRPPFAGKTAILAESLMHTFEGAPILALGQEIALQEDSMAASRTTTSSMKSVFGAAALAIGSFLLFVNLDGIAAQINDTVGAPAESVGIFPALGLAGLHALQAFAFDHTGFLSSLLQILVSFWPLILVLLGTALLRSALGENAAKSAVVATPTSGRIR